jgi:hypothetical protein
MMIGTAPATATFRPGAIWNDTNGEAINAHGGGLLHDRGIYYWYGEFKVAGPEGNSAQVGVSCYSSTDLYHWENEGIVLPVVDDPDHDLTRGCVIERPKVVYNRKTGEYVLWFHLELKGQGYAAARCGVAVSDMPTGPFLYRESFRPDGEMSRDMTIFVDDDDQAYLFCASEENSTLHISALTPDYRRTAGRFERVFVGRSMEAPAVFKHRGRYYFIGSGCTGWAPNAARLAVADTVLGPYVELGNPCLGPDAELTFLAQSTYVLPVAGRDGAFIFLADRWHPKNPIDGRYVWLPIEFSEHGLSLRWRDSWDLSVFDSFPEDGIARPLPLVGSVS